MIHASMELLTAMEGRPMWGWANRACFREDGNAAVYATLYREGHPVEDARPVDCLACLVKMRAATCPARWDFLETLGLAPRLEAK